jgi:small glutamine-rich tetratricopeptide repeat-containing protein alpha
MFILLSYSIFSAIALDASNPIYYCNRAAAYSRTGDYQKAIDDCNQAIRYDSSYGKGK